MTGAATEVTCKCGKKHRSARAALRCALGSVIEAQLGNGPYAVLHGFDVRSDRGRRWHRASRVNVRMFEDYESAREALAGMYPVPCSGTCIGHSLVHINVSGATP